MYTTYSIEKVASQNRQEALAAAEARRVARQLPRATHATRQGSPSAATVGVPRPRRWFGVALAGR